MQTNKATDYKTTDLATRLGATHTATLNGHVLRFHSSADGDDFDGVLPIFVKESGGGVPAIESCFRPTVVQAVAAIGADMRHPQDFLRRVQEQAAAADGPDARLAATLTTNVADVAPSFGNVVKQPTTNTFAPLRTGQYDVIGDARSQQDRDAAKAAGFAPAAPVYRQGLRADGMRGHRDEFLKLPLAGVAAKELQGKVEDERRRDVVVTAMDVRMSKSARLAQGDMRWLLDRTSFGSLVNRLGMPPGASSYLGAVEPELRAINLNRWVAGSVTTGEAHKRDAALALKKDYAPETLVLRTRDAIREAGSDGERAREVYGVVSESYAAFDADKLARAVQLAVPEGARALVTYDGRRTKFDVLFFSDIIPEHAVAGEFFKAGVQISTADDGGGSIVVRAMIWQNLCLNFIIIDEDAQAVARIRHVGTPEKLAAKFREAFAAALGKIDHFVKAWGYAQEEDVIARSLVLAKNTGEIAADEVEAFALLPVSAVLPGIFNAIIERDLVPLPKRDRAKTVADLMTMWERDESAATRDRQGTLTRAAVVNAITRYSHEVNEDPFFESELELAAGALLFGKKGAPAPLPYLPLAASV